MRYLVGFVVLMASPLSASAQTGEEDATLAQEPAASSEPAPQEPALKLELDDAGVWLVTDWQALKEMERAERRVHLAGRVGMPISALTLAVGGILFGASYGGCDGFLSISFEPSPPCAPPRERNPGLRIAGLTLMPLGAAGMIVSGALLGGRKRELRELRRAHHGTRRRAQWDLAQGRLVF